MKAASFGEALARHPHLVDQVVDKLRQVQRGLEPGQIDWYLVDCHDDPLEPIDERSIADLLLTGSVRCRHGIRGIAGSHFACFCDENCGAE